MIGDLNRLVDYLEEHLSEEIDVAALAGRTGTTEYHLRRMFSSLAGISVTEYVRRRRMTLAAAELVEGGRSLLDIATTYGYGSTEAFGRAFQAVHGVKPGELRRSHVSLSPQQRLRFRLTIEGNTPMDARIIDRPDFALIGRAARVPLIHEGVNPHIAAHIASLPPTEHERLKALSDTEPSGLLQVSADVDPDYTEGSELTYLHGVAIGSGTPRPGELDAIEVPAGRWAVFTAAGAYPAVLQRLWASTATDWFPSNPWRLRPGPSIVAILERAEDFSTATAELWLPVEPA
jgi:AraC family transcriptional regulator